MKNSVNLPWFALVYVATMVGVAIVVMILSAAFGIDVPGNVTQLVPLLVATMHVGKMYFEDYQEVPDAKEAWAASRRMTLVEMAISLPIAVVISLLMFGTSPDMGWHVLGPVLLVGLVLIAAMSLVLKRFLFVQGAKASLKQHEKTQSA